MGTCEPAVFICVFINSDRTENTIFVLMDELLSFGCIKLYKYSKTSRRGVNELEVGVGEVEWIGVVTSLDSLFFS